ncbi:DegV family protein [Paucilactobacillus suebicus]|uniref:DegV family protein n=1 Tax=Paucilactobacillus suebicus DSM 5007 = KCTC 3549 TaxID=1423807 RepID=A0A0R1W2E2_9LACO|nr:DegV family protein [Paucilactobacillus suebicus]KRM11733.1 hypothetical protein FD16_GL000522 [Paucilactobacillus suebicus DSM 5007 = KCTC 3549]
MKTAVVTDSAAYIDPKLVAQYNITVVPITVIFNQHPYLENVDIDSKTFFEKLRTEEKLPSTAQITMGQMQSTYDHLANEGYDEVISIHLSSGITGFFENLEALVSDYHRITVHLFDSKIASAGEANMALLAGKLASEGKNADEIMPLLERELQTTGVNFMVDDLHHLLRTGRISNSSAIIGNLLKIKPLLTFNDKGQIIVDGKERTVKRAFRKILDNFASSIDGADYPIRATIIDANDEKVSENWLAQFKDEFPNIPVDTSHLGPVISVHTGEKTMGLVWAYDWQKA